MRITINTPPDRGPPQRQPAGGDARLRLRARLARTSGRSTRSSSNTGTMPNDELYLALKPQSRNGGEVDHMALIGGGRLCPERNPEGRFDLFRIGDAIASRNIHRRDL